MVDNVCGYKIEVIHRSYQAFLEKLADADLILTPTRRLATRLNKDYAQTQKNVWQIDITSITGWLERLWQDYQDDPNNPILLRLNAWQNQLLWQEIIESDQTPLLRKESTATLAQQAWRLLKEWSIAWESIDPASASQDIQIFLSWCAQYQERCQHDGLCDVSSIFANLKPKSINKIYLIGFTDIKPAIQKLFKHLHEQGTQIEVLEYREENPHVYCAPQADAQAELIQAALWAKELLTKNPQGPIGVIVPDLAARFNEVDNVFAKILLPQSILANHYHDQKPYNISSGNKLADYPIIAIVFELLKYNPNKMPVQNLSKILLSPFIKGGMSEYTQRSQ